MSKPKIRMNNKHETKHKTDETSWGTKVAEKARAVANTLSDSEREKLLNEGLAVIYGGQRTIKATANRR